MRRGKMRAIMLAGAVALAGPLMAQESQPHDLAVSLAEAEAARARLDLPAALSTLDAAIEAAPDAVAPLVARAAIHRSMGRLSLALADLDAALTLAPEDAEALGQRAETLRRAGEIDRAVADFARARALRPDDPGLAAAEAAALAQAGRKNAALAAYVRAADLAPGDDTLRAARDALLADLAETTRPGFVFEADALVGDAFTIAEGAETAPNHLILVRDGAELATEGTVAPDRLARAVAAEALRITHVFTYSGRTSTIWANLSLICAGPALGATEAALMSIEGQRALADIEQGNGTEALEALIAAAYGLGGQDGERVEGCAFDRDHALAYLADWTAAQERIGWRGETYLDRPPTYVLNGEPVAAGWLDAWLAAQVPSAEDGTQEPVLAEEMSGDEPATGLPDAPEPAAEPAPATGDDGAAAADETGQDEGEAPVEVEADAAPETDPLAADSTAEPPVPVAVAEAALARITLPPPAEIPVESPVATGAGDSSEGEAPDAVADSAPDPAAAQEPDPAPVEAPAMTERAETDMPEDSAGETSVEPEPVPEAEPQAPDAGADEGETDDAEPDEVQPDTDEPDGPAPGEAAPEDATEDIRLARILKGIWAPSLTQCLAYLDAIKTPETLDQAMPDPAADPPLDAMLVTSRRAQPFDSRGQVCVVESFSESGDESDALLSCTDSDGGVGTMRLHAYPSGGPTPWLDVTRGTEEKVAMRQCVTLGQLGVRFADLWQIDKTACTARAPMRGVELEFRPDDGALWVTVRPEAADTALPGANGLAARVDDVALAPGAGTVEGGGFSAPLGAFEDVSRHLSFGMFLFLSASDDSGFATLRLPLLGSSRAMAALADCAE